jgi:hypothetical protein
MIKHVSLVWHGVDLVGYHLKPVVVGLPTAEPERVAAATGRRAGRRVGPNSAADLSRNLRDIRRHGMNLSISPDGHRTRAILDRKPWTKLATTTAR